jgi:hypothetical protein
MSDIDKDWCLNMAALEGDAEIGAGSLSQHCPNCEAEAAEIVRIKERMGWRIEAQAAEIDRLRGLLAEAVEYPASDYLDNGVLNRIYAALEGKAEQ